MRSGLLEILTFLENPPDIFKYIVHNQYGCINEINSFSYLISIGRSDRTSRLECYMSNSKTCMFNHATAALLGFPPVQPRMRKRERAKI